MRIAEVIGRVTLSRVHPSLKGGRYLVALPMPPGGADRRVRRRGEEVVAYDELGAGPRQPDRPERGPRGGQPVRQGEDARRRLLRLPARPDQL